jgi:Rrf2 family protein
MKLSLKVEYACQVLAQLGYTVNAPDLPHIEDLARAEAVPSNYLVQILNELRTAGLIISRRGKQGGYALARPAAEITLCDVMQAVEGNILAHGKAGEGHSSRKTAEIWEQVSERFTALLREYTIEDCMSAPSRDMWYI